MAHARRVVARLGREESSVQYGPPWDHEGRIDVPGGSMAYAIMGQGEPVVLLHMLGGWITNWRQVAPLLAERRRVIALDLAGHGASDYGSPAEWKYSLENQARDVTRALDSLVPSPVTVIANSLGGCTSVQIAAQDPERIDRLALISVMMNGKETVEQIKAKEAADGWFDASGQPLPRDAATAMTISGTHDPAVQAEQNASRKVAGQWILACERGVRTTDMAGMLHQVKIPVLLMYGARDPYKTLYEERALGSLANARSVHVEDSGRFPHMEQPHRTAELLTEWLKS